MANVSPSSDRLCIANRRQLARSYRRLSRAAWRRGQSCSLLVAWLRAYPAARTLRTHCLSRSTPARRDALGIVIGIGDDPRATLRSRDRSIWFAEAAEQYDRAVHANGRVAFVTARSLRYTIRNGQAGKVRLLETARLDLSSSLQKEFRSAGGRDLAMAYTSFAAASRNLLRAAALVSYAR